MERKVCAHYWMSQNTRLKPEELRLMSEQEAAALKKIVNRKQYSAG